MAKKWIQAATKKMKAKGTVGKFSKAAKKEDESTHEFAEKEVHSKKTSPLMKKRAQFAINMSKMKHKKK